ncbi:TPA: glycosyltransferase family 2 protein [Stenotrophomonas maltophilia]|uniref:glycosyltransferase family 2 protein n=1 Tax=Stenotrophomonas TaxID=40323 RepID=UPI001AA18949|nr:MULTISPECIES: glycosyltransferase [Stenotrophomonas]ELF4108030.1 glycosyltransferase [Stenotrophomonas maltophilia]MBO1742250.1 glycosyltransferase [Stenotrophomonas maltophilia]MCU1176354.1 glycosyltransferase [Stenotrophomonas maltophilia]WAP02467.1 glycosyltransferase [Stenotrophomonas sp. SBJS02]HEA4093747.1 glycosyltransferase [Stenotrophomonas maltophilia]
MTASVSAFISVVYVMRNHGAHLAPLLSETVGRLGALATDYELVVVDNGSTDESVARLRELTGEGGLPNLQVYALTQTVAWETAAWAGVESALGDFIVVLDPLTDDLSVLPQLLETAVTGTDVVFANNQARPRLGVAYRLASAAFNHAFRWLNGVDPGTEAPQYRVMSRTVVNYILQHPRPAAIYRLLPVTAGFTRANVTYRYEPRASPEKKLGQSIDRGMRLLVSSTRLPIRLVTMLSTFGALANLLYSFYVLAIAVFKADVAPGWVSLSLQQSGMFLLISLVLLVLGEYILHMAALSNEGPSFHVAQEFNSARLERLERVNVERTAGPSGRA